MAAAVASKRKREAQDLAGGRPHAAINATGSDEFEQHYLQADEDGVENADGVIDFAAALAQHGADPSEDADETHEVEEAPTRSAKHTASDTAAAAIAQYHTMTVPQSTEQIMMAQRDTGDGSSFLGDRANDTSFSEMIDQADSAAHRDLSPESRQRLLFRGGNKPAVGSEEWHKVRRDNHKEVERRRRETINEGINELAKIVPGCEKNKGSILARAVQFITQLKENEMQNIEKWTLEKLLTEQAIAELSSSCDKLKAECQRAWGECEQWKKAAQKAGLSVDIEKAEPETEEAD